MGACRFGGVFPLTLFASIKLWAGPKVAALN